MFRLAAACEGLDDDDAAAAAATRTWQHAGFVGGCGCGRLGLFRAGRHGKQLAHPRDVGGAIAVGELSVMADAVQALGQHVRQEAPNELAGQQGHGCESAPNRDPAPAGVTTLIRRRESAEQEGPDRRR
jgi:hypothetical protein